MEIRRKYIVVLICSMIALLIFSSCSSSVKNERAIIKDLSNHPDFFNVQDIKIDKLKISKRQTNKRDKTDYIWLTVFGHCNDIKYELGYQLTYKLYNKGWMLDEVVWDRNGAWSISTHISDEQIKDNILHIAHAYSNNSEISNMVVEPYPETTNETYQSIRVKFTTSNENVIYNIYCVLQYQLSYDGWSLKESRNEVTAVPLNTVLQSDIDNFIEKMRIEERYDSIEIERRDTDLENGNDSIYIIASQKNTYNDVRYEVIISSIFDKRTGEWNTSIGERKVIEQNWNIVGKYEVEFSAGGPYSTRRYKLKLTILNLYNETIHYISEVNMQNILGENIDYRFEDNVYYDEYLYYEDDPREISFEIGIESGMYDGNIYNKEVVFKSNEVLLITDLSDEYYHESKGKQSELIKIN